MVGSIAAPHDTETQDPVLTVDLHQLREEGREGDNQLMEEGREKDNNYMCVGLYSICYTHHNKVATDTAVQTISEIISK